MQINIKLFDLIKNQKWDEFNNFLDKNKDIDLNIRDKSQNYLIQYIVLYNQINIFKKLVLRGSKLDIDSDGRTIIFIPIKYRYNKLLEEIIKHEDLNVGIMITELQDSFGFYPIHYLVKFQNIEGIKLFIKYNKFKNYTDKLGNTPLHLAVVTKNEELFNLILNNSDNLDIQNNDGDTPLHIACNYEQKKMVKMLLNKNANVNIQNYNEQITPLIYSIITNDNEIFEILLKKSNLEIQDRNGNNCLHYCIMEKNYQFINDIIGKGINLNTTNIESKTPLHIILKQLSYDKSDISKFDLPKLIINTNINIQDNIGNSCFFLLCKYGFWKKLIPVLQNLKFRIFLKNQLGESIFDIILDEDKDIFFNLITKSYINYIRNNQNLKFKQKLYELCQKQLNLNSYKINENDLDYFIEDNILNKDKKDVCFNVIKHLLVRKKLSYPQKIKNYCINLDEFKEDIKLYTYSGITLDVVCGFINLHEIFDNIYSTVTTNFIENQDLKNYYINDKNKFITDEDFINFEIIWDKNKIFYPNNLDLTIEKFKKSDKQYFIFPIGIELANGSHANVLIYDRKINEIERFEPNGSSYPYNFNYNPKLLDQYLKEKFTEVFKDCKYIYPKDYLPKIGFQLLEDHNKNKKIGDPGGFCAVWCVWYCYMRIKNNTLARKRFVLKVINKIRYVNLPFKTIIRNYAQRIVNLRNKLLVDSNLDINKWINSNYKPEIYDNFILKIKKKIIEVIK